jgi:type I restriction enzyme S subunit
MPMLDDELERCTAIKGDLLICEGGEAGRAAVWPYDREISFQNHVHRARFFAGINPYFVQRYIAKLNATGEIEKYRKGVGISNMSGKALASVLVPLPPLAEQKRIVAKVDELMTLCDRLEVQQKGRETRHAALARASLARFADAPTPANLQFLFHPSYDIPPADLRKSILTLAVQGKLVPQDPNDEPADILLRRISDEKRMLISEKVFRKSQTTENSIARTDGEILPTTWKWAKADDLFFTTKLAGFEYTDHMRLTDKGEVPVIRAQNVKPDGVLKTHLKFVDRQTSEALPRSALTKPALLVTFIGAGIGDVALFDEPDRWHLAPNVAKMEPFNARGEKLSIRYLLLFMQSPFGRGEIFKHIKSTAQPSISMATIRDIDLPVPPLAEQRRIVVKVEQLMALVDALETQLAASRDKGQKLLEAIVSELTLTS